MQTRKDDFEVRAAKLMNMTDEQLEKYFWELANKVVDPLIELAEKNTSPSVERSVLLRMGFSSMQAGKLVDMIFTKGLLGKGAGHVVLKVSEELKTDVVSAGLTLIEGKNWEIVDKHFKGGEA